MKQILQKLWEEAGLPLNPSAITKEELADFEAEYAIRLPAFCSLPYRLCAADRPFPICSDRCHVRPGQSNGGVGRDNGRGRRHPGRGAAASSASWHRPANRLLVLPDLNQATEEDAPVVLLTSWEPDSDGLLHGQLMALCFHSFLKQQLTHIPTA